MVLLDRRVNFFSRSPLSTPFSLGCFWVLTTACPCLSWSFHHITQYRPSADGEFDEGSALCLTWLWLQSPAWCFSRCLSNAWVTEKNGIKLVFPISLLIPSLCSNYASVSLNSCCGTHKMPCSETVGYDLCLLLVAF